MDRFKIRKSLGERYGQLTVLEEVAGIMKFNKDGSPYTYRLAKCVCDCGKEVVISVLNLFKGTTKSCGCLRKTRRPTLTHGLSRTNEHRIWAAMNTRCRGTKHKLYGARGIHVCKRWAKSFPNFLKDVGKRPSKKHSLERRNNYKGYSKANCYWATATQQVRNRRVTKKAMYNGKLIPVAEIAEIENMDYHFLNDRLLMGWTIVEAIKYPKNTKIKSVRKCQN